MKIAEHFTIKELTFSSYADYLADNIYYALDHFNELVRLAQFCEKVREIIGKPMTITSGVRTKQLNKKIGGVDTSDHIKLLAVDFVPSKIKLKTAFDKIRRSNLDYKQLILEKNTWIHISIGDKRENLTYDGKKYRKV
ncbi:MAG: peptidase M15 [Elusimicrobia bacterium]|nr:peptidase M15 [Elusimicrobiota bacterium]